MRIQPSLIDVKPYYIGGDDYIERDVIEQDHGTIEGHTP